LRKTACNSPVRCRALYMMHCRIAHSVLGPIWSARVPWGSFIHCFRSEWIDIFVFSREGHDECPNRSRFGFHITIYCASLFPKNNGVITRCFTTMVKMVKTTSVWRCVYLKRNFEQLHV
jgi:hypothetical protein